MQLNEYTFGWSTSSPTQIAFFQTKNADWPFLIISCTSLAGLKDEKGVFNVLKINTKQSMAEWRQNRTLKNKQSADFDPKLDRFLLKVHRRDVLSIMQEIDDYPWLVKNFPCQGRTKLYELLVNRMHMDPPMFEKLFGSIGDLAAHSDHEKYHDAIVLFPDGLRNSKRSQMVAFLDAVDTILQRESLRYLLEEGLIVFKPITRNAVGLYIPGTKSQITIDPSAKISMHTIRTIIHELGHKLQYEYIEEADKAEVINQYRKAHFSKNTAVPRANAPDGLYRVGTKIEYLGKGKKLKAGSPYEVEIIKQDKLRVASTTVPHMYLNAEPQAFITPEWSIDGVPQGKLEVPVGSSWFPTAYSKTDPWEWFCELFAFSLEGKVVGEPKEWLDSFLAKYRRG